MDMNVNVKLQSRAGHGLDIGNRGLWPVPIHGASVGHQPLSWIHFSLINGISLCLSNSVALVVAPVLKTALRTNTVHCRIDQHNASGNNRARGGLLFEDSARHKHEGRRCRRYFPVHSRSCLERSGYTGYGVEDGDYDFMLSAEDL